MNTSHQQEGAAVIAVNAQARSLEPVNFSVPRGSMTALVGPSGSGKTTLMRMIVGIQRNVRGEITVLGLPAGAPELRHTVAYATQAASVFDDLTVRENLMYFARIYGLNKDRVTDVIKQVDLTEYPGTVVRRLSGGQRGRVSLAVALLPEPELLILDEPTAGLDPVLRAKLWEMFGSLVAQGKTIIVSSHVLDEAEHCDHLLFLRDGALLQSTPEEVKKQTNTTTIEQAFMELMNS